MGLIEDVVVIKGEKGLNIKEFVEKSQETMIYRTDDVKAHCLFAGILEEYAEVDHELDRLFHGETDDTSDLIGELGDFCFKVYNLGCHFGYIDFEYIGDDCFDFEIHVPILAKVSKKTARDDNGKLVNPDRIANFKYVMDLLHTFIIDVCADHNLNLSDVLSYNVEKLQSRLKRGVLSGEGSHR